jgi:hypothetical protein
VLYLTLGFVAPVISLAAKVVQANTRRKQWTHMHE